MVEILIGPEMIKRLWRKLFPKKVKTAVTIAMGIPDWVRKPTLKDQRKSLANHQADPPQNDIINK